MKPAAKDQELRRGEDRQSLKKPKDFTKEEMDDS
jgi:hypothetical protein